MKKCINKILFIFIFAAALWYPSNVSASTYYLYPGGDITNAYDWWDTPYFDNSNGYLPASGDTGYIGDGMTGVTAYANSNMSLFFHLYIQQNSTLTINANVTITGDVSLADGTTLTVASGQEMTTQATFTASGYANADIYGTLVLSGGTSIFGGTGAFTVRNGGILNLQGGSTVQGMTIDSGGIMYINGSTELAYGSNINVSGTLNIQHTFTQNGTLSVSGTVNVNAPSSTYLYYQNGSVTIDSGGVFDVISNASGSQLFAPFTVNTGGELKFGSNATITSAISIAGGTLTVYNSANISLAAFQVMTIDSGGHVVLNDGSGLSAEGESHIDIVDGDISVNSNSSLTVQSYGLLDIKGTSHIDIESTGYFAVDGTLNTTDSTATLNINCGGAFSLGVSGTFTNDGTFSYTSFSNSGTFIDNNITNDLSASCDAVAPTITNVSSDKANGTYGVGAVIDIDVTFSEAVTSTGNVTVTLETGGVDRQCTFSVSSNVSHGTCNYTVQAGDTTSDLTVSSISGTIVDQASNAMTNFVPATNLAANKALVIDTTAPTLSSIASSTTQTTAHITWTTNEVATSTLQYGLSTSYGSASSSATATTSHAFNLSGLTAGTTYHFKINSYDAVSNLATSTDRTFTTVAAADTTPPAAPTSFTATASGSSAILSWVNPVDGDFSTVTVRRSVSGYPASISDGVSVTTTSGTTYTNTGLSDGTYYYSIFASDTNANVSTRATASVTISTIVLSAPTLTIQSASSITDTQATLNASITSDGNASSTVRGFHYGLTTSYGSTTSVGGSLGITPFYDTVTGLTCNTTYHFRGYATNSQGTGTSTDNTFTTSACSGGGDVTAPTVSTVAAVTTPTTDTTPNYSFTTDEAGTITYGGSCSSQTTSASVGVNTITFNMLSSGTYSNCTIIVTDASSNASTLITIPSFTIAASSNGGGGGSSGSSVSRSAVTSPTNQVVVAPGVSTETASGLPQNFKFLKDIRLNTAKSDDTKLLQTFLNSKGFLVASFGPGSKGKETRYFGPATRKALAAFQKSVGITPAVGFFGPKTRAYINGVR